MKQYDQDLSFIFNLPTRIVYGAGTLRELPIELERLNAQKVVLITDSVLKTQTDMVEKAEKLLGKRCCGVFSDVPSDSGVQVVEAAYEFAHKNGADSVVSLGGGSVIDTAKGVALLVREGGHLRDYEGFQMLTRPVAPHVSIPTTAGTGSEVTYVAVIKDPERKIKLLFGSEYLYPNTGILDPLLTVGLPAHLTAATGMDAMSHAIEGLHSAQAEPIADALALHAIRLLKENIPKCVAEPGNVTARGLQLLASNMAGAAFSNAQVGLVHAMAHTIGAHHHVHHGLANSIFLPHVIRFNMDVALDAYYDIAQIFGTTAGASSKEEAVSKMADRLAEFAAGLGIQTKLRELNIPESAFPELAELTLYDGAIVYNAKPVFDAAEILKVYQAAY